jgi:hypothetical protein
MRVLQNFVFPLSLDCRKRSVEWGTIRHTSVEDSSGLSFFYADRKIRGSLDARPSASSGVRVERDVWRSGA